MGFELLIAVVGTADSEEAAAIAVSEFRHLVMKLRRIVRHAPIAVVDETAGTLKPALAQAVGQLRLSIVDLAPVVTSDVTMTDAICRFAHVLVVVNESHASARHDWDALLALWKDSTRGWLEHSPEFEPELELSTPCIGPAYLIEIRKDDVAARLRLKGKRSRAPVRLLRADDEHAQFHLRTPEGSRPLREFDRINCDLRRASANQQTDTIWSLVSAQDWARLQPHIEADALGKGSKACLQDTFEAYAAAERFAVDIRKLVLQPLHWIIAMSLPVSVAAYEISNAVAASEWRLGIGLYLAVFLAAALTVLTVRAFQAQERWHDARLTAELLRVSVWWRVAGVGSQLEPTLTWCLPGQVIGTTLLARAIDLRMQRIGAAEVDLTMLVRDLWVGPSPDEEAYATDSKGHTQTVWYRKSASKQLRSAHSLAGAQIGFLIVAIAFASLAIGIGESVADPGFLRDLIAPSGVSILPAAAGAMAILRERRAHIALAESYHRMARVSETTTRRLLREQSASDPARRRIIIEQFGQAVLAEGVDWLVVNRQRSISLT